jgi:Ca-activated chloride channel family protein
VITELDFARLDLAHLLWASLAVLAACAWGVARRRAILEVFGLDASRAREWLSACTRRRWLRATVLAVAIGFLAAAAVQPRSNPEKTQFKSTARDIAVLLDVSKSMLAEDLQPNRLERAKLEIARLSERLKGDRIGLIAFAGKASILCPLTSNYSYFKSVVRNVSTRSAEQGGTRIGDAVRKALDDLLGAGGKALPAAGEERRSESILEEEMRAERKAFADILLITDGEDHDSYPERAAATAARADVGLYIVGLGSEHGAPIPVRSREGRLEYLTYKGEIVRTSLNSKALMELTHIAPRGAYLPAGTDNFDLVDFYEKTLGREKGREVVEEHVSWTEIFQPFLLAGFILYLLYLALPERPARRPAAALVEAAP